MGVLFPTGVRSHLYLTECQRSYTLDKHWRGRETRLGEGREAGRQESLRQVCSKA